jgi:tRNA A37 methylthiotransferase MiaB
MKKACVSYPIGCDRSMLDATHIVKYLKANDYEITNNFQDADLILMGACGVTSKAEKYSIKYLSIANKKKKVLAQLVVFGCLTGIAEQYIKNKYHAIILNRATFHQLDKTINAKNQFSRVKMPNDLYNYRNYLKMSFSFYDRLSSKFNISLDVVSKSIEKINNFVHYGKTRPKFTLRDTRTFDIRVATGCDADCSYCVIKIATGSFSSKPLDEILEELNHGLSQGYDLIRLLAEDIGAYGQDQGLSVVDLLQALTSINADYQICIDDFSPRWLIKHYPQLHEIFAKNLDKIRYICMPIQSGSDMVIRLMHRGYSATEAKQLMAVLRRSFPFLKFTTHIIVGFPGETEDDFAETLQFIKDVKFDRVDIYKYTDRPNTLSITMDNKISEFNKFKRIVRIIRSLEPGICFIC